MSKKLLGKVALITGGSRGIGAEIARHFAKEGADVIISYSASVEKATAVVTELELLGVRAAAIQADQSISKEVEELVKKAFGIFGRLDILVNNAGGVVEKADISFILNVSLLKQILIYYLVETYATVISAF